MSCHFLKSIFVFKVSQVLTMIEPPTQFGEKLRRGWCGDDEEGTVSLLKIIINKKNMVETA